MEPPALAEPIVVSQYRGLVQLDQRQRLWALGVACILLGLLGVSRWLSPHPNGMGTHQQLGLPPCTFLILFGIPCPTCGMTTSWAHLMHGNLADSWSTNPGGTCLAIIAAIAGVWSLVTSIRGRYRKLLPGRVTGAIAFGITAITLISWCGRIF